MIARKTFFIRYPSWAHLGKECQESVRYRAHRNHGDRRREFLDEKRAAFSKTGRTVAGGKLVPGHNEGGTSNSHHLRHRHGLQRGETWKSGHALVKLLCSLGGILRVGKVPCAE